MTSRSRKKSFSTVRRVLLADIVRNHHQCQKTFFVARANTEFALFAHLTFFLNTKTFRPYYDGEAEVVSSSTLPLCNLFSRWHKWPRGWHPLFLISSEFLLALSDKKNFTLYDLQRLISKLNEQKKSWLNWHFFNIYVLLIFGAKIQMIEFLWVLSFGVKIQSFLWENTFKIVWLFMILVRKFKCIFLLMRIFN